MPFTTVRRAGGYCRLPLVSNAATFTPAQVQAEIAELRRVLSPDRWALVAARMVANHAPQLADALRRQIVAALPNRHDQYAALALLPPLPVVVIAPPPPPPEAPRDGSAPVGTMWLDPELTRVLVALGHGIAARVYWTARQLTADGDGSGKVSETAIVAALIDGGATVQRRTIERHWFTAGDGLLWRRHGGNLYLVSYARRLPALVVELAHAADRAELVTTNYTGAPFVAVPTDGGIKAFYARCLQAWHVSRHGHTRNISRAALERLTGRTRKTLQAYEKTTGIKAKPAYAVIHDDHYTPPYAVPILQNDGHAAALAQLPNRYTAPPLTERHHRQTPQTARRRHRHALETIADNADTLNRASGATASSSRVGFLPRSKRLYWHAPTGHAPTVAYKALRRHMRHHDDGAPHYVYLGHSKRQRADLYDLSDGTSRAWLNGRVVARLETLYLTATARRGDRRAAWRV